MTDTDSNDLFCHYSCIWHLSDKISKTASYNIENSIVSDVKGAQHTLLQAVKCFAKIKFKLITVFDSSDNRKI